MSNTPSLKPCPFCGSAGHFESDSDGWHWVECESCGMQGNRGASLMEDCKPMLAEAWNRRTPQPVVREPLGNKELQAISLEYSASEDECTGFRDGWRFAEKHYGITQKGGSNVPSA